MTLTPPLIPLRYDTPTVTLTVMTREAAVSRWSERPVVQVWRYQIQIRSLSDPEDGRAIEGDRHTFSALQTAVQRYIHTHLAGTVSADPKPVPPYLTPQGLTRHALHLGALHPAHRDRPLILSAMQLADLGTVFDQLEAQVRPLPIALTASTRRQQWRQWGAAAAGMVAAVGVTTALWPLYQSQQASEETAMESQRLDSARPESAELEALERSPAPPTASEAPSEGESSELNQVIVKPTPVPSPAPGAGDSDEKTAPPAAATAPKPATEQTAPPPPAAPELAESTPPPTETESAPAPGVAAESPPPAADAAETAEAFSLPDADATARSAPRVAIAASIPNLATQLTEQWQPPSDLDQALTYVFTVDTSGILTDIRPVDDIGTEQRDRVPLPNMGTPLLPASGAPQQIRVTFSPDGSVQAEAIAADSTAQ